MIWQSRPWKWPGPLLLLTNRNVVVAGVLLTAALLVANGVHILATGRWWFGRPADPSKLLPYGSRLALGVFYLGLATILAILAGRLW